MSRRRAPLSPEARDLLAAMNGLSRRRLLQAAGLGGVALAAAACGAGGGDDPSSSAAPQPTGSSTSSSSAPAPEEDKVVIWSNWPLYIDVDDENGSNPSLAAFTAQTGIKVEYSDDINDNNEFYAKVRAQLEQGQPIERDIVTLTDWMAALWISNGYVQKFDRALVPNAKNLIPRLASVPFDPTREYSLPWQSGYGALGWNKELLKGALGTDTMTSLDQLFDPRLKGRITVLSEMRDTMGIILAYQGADPSNFTEDQWSAALAFLTEQVASGQIRQVTGNDYAGALDNGDVIAVIGWSGDMIQLGDAFGVALPETGATLWTDNLMVPASAVHPRNAATVFNYYYEPKVAAEVAAYVQYICPVLGAKEAMAEIDPTLVDNPYIFPTEADLNRAYVFMTLTPEQQDSYERGFQKAIGN